MAWREDVFQCDELIYIQMQKTGSTHIASLLSNLFDGEFIGKHNAAPEILIESKKYFISSIRNPWDWYLSLWAFGVRGKGDLMHQLTKRHFLHSLKSAIRNPKRNYAGLIQELSKDISMWLDVYERNDEIDAFRKWLMLIHDSGNSHLLGEGYGDTSIAGFCGFMTYRYFYLCCRNLIKLNNPDLFSSYADLIQFDRANCYIDFFIQQESLADNLCEAIENVRPLSGVEKESIYAAKKLNTSGRSLTKSDYYNEELIELVRIRDKVLIDKFKYSFP